MQRLGHVEAHVLLQGVLQRRAEHLGLLGGGHGGVAVEHRVDELVVDVGGVPGEVEGAVDVGGAIVEGGEHEAHLRRPHHPVALAAVEGVVPAEVAQGRLRQLHRADAHHQIVEHLFAVGAVANGVCVAEGHVVGVVHHEDQVVPLQLQRVDDLPAQGLRPGIHRQGGVAQPHQQLVGLVVHHLTCLKGDLQQVAAGLPGQGAAKQGQVLFLLLLGKVEQGAVEGGHHFALFVDVAAPHAADGVLVRRQPAPYLGDLFFVHGISRQRGRSCESNRTVPPLTHAPL